MCWQGGCAKRAGKKASSFFTLPSGRSRDGEFAVSQDPKAQELRAAFAKSARTYTPSNGPAARRRAFGTRAGPLPDQREYPEHQVGLEIKGLVPEFGGPTATNRKIWDLNRRNGGRYLTEWDRRFAVVYDSPDDVGRRGLFGGGDLHAR